MQCKSFSGVTAEIPVQLSVCTGDIPLKAVVDSLDFYTFLSQLGLLIYFHQEP